MITNRQTMDNVVERLKVPPHSIEAEQNILGSILIDTNVIDLVFAQLSDDEFYSRSHQIIFKTMVHLVSQAMPVDSTTVSEALKQVDENQVDLGYLAELAINTPSSANVATYVKIVKDRALLRQTIGAANNIAEQCYNTDGLSVREILGDAEMQLSKVTDQQAKKSISFDMVQTAGAALDHMEKQLKSKQELSGISTGIPDLDDRTNGLEPGNSIIIAGRPSMGKSTLALNIAEHTAMQGKHVQIFSLEMTKEEIMFKFMASQAQVDLDKIQRPGSQDGMDDEDWARVSNALAFIKEWNMNIVDSGSLDMPSIRLEMRQDRKKNGPQDLVIIDYLQLIKGRRDAQNRTIEVGEISRQIKQLAKEFKCPIISLCQLNRSLEQRKDKRPINADLRDSGELEQDADKIIFVYRDEIYNDKTEDKGLAELILSKCRMGRVGTSGAVFQGQYSRFLPLAENQEIAGYQPPKKSMAEAFS